MKKALALIVSLCLLLACVPGFALELLSGADTYPISTDKTITWYVQSNPTPHESFVDWKESPFHTGLSEMTGINIEWSFPTQGADGTVFSNALLADPTNLPDIMGYDFSLNATMFLDDEVIWDLTPYLEEYAPAYYAYLKSVPAYDKGMKTDDGRYYCIDFFREDGGWNDTYRGPVVRKDWMEECGLTIPAMGDPFTIEDFENIIRTFNEKYGAKFSFGYNRFKDGGIEGAFGAYATANEKYFIADGKVGLAQAEPEWRDYVSWLNGLYEEGLIDQDCFSLDDTSVKAKIHNDEVGISMTSMGQVTNWNKERVAAGKDEVWIALPYPTDANGNISAVFGGTGMGGNPFSITKCADEETMKLCLQALDYAFTQEGFLYWNYGKEGVSWVMGDDGIPQFTELVTADTDVDPMTKYNGTTWSGPCIQATNLLYLKNSQTAIDANDLWFYSFPVEVTSGHWWPKGTTFTTEESDELDLIAGGIGTYTAESFANFVTGAQDIDDDAVWESYIANYDANYNLSRILEIRQACYDRYINR